MQREEEIGAPPIDSTIIVVHKINRCFSVNLGEQPQPQDLRVGVIPLVEPIYREGTFVGKCFGHYLEGAMWWMVCVVWLGPAAASAGPTSGVFGVFCCWFCVRGSTAG